MENNFTKKWEKFGSLMGVGLQGVLIANVLATNTSYSIESAVVAAPLLLFGAYNLGSMFGTGASVIHDEKYNHIINIANKLSQKSSSFYKGISKIINKVNNYFYKSENGEAPFEFKQDEKWHNIVAVSVGSMVGIAAYTLVNRVDPIFAYVAGTITTAPAVSLTKTILEFNKNKVSQIRDAIELKSNPVLTTKPNI